MQYTISVTQADIDKGCKGNTENCPVAKAVARAFPTSDWVSVGFMIGVRLTEKGRYCDWVSTPAVARRFIKLFDAGAPVEPFKFKITFE